MFNKKQAIIENGWDRAYKQLVNDRFAAYNELEDTIKNCFIKDAATRLFPQGTESYAETIHEFEDAQERVWQAKMYLAVAIQNEQEYYRNNHDHFVACKDYINPFTFSITEMISNIIIRVKGY